MHIIFLRPGWRTLNMCSKLCCSILLLFFTISVIGQPSTNKLKQEVTLHQKDKPLLDILHELRKQTGLVFFYANDILDDSQRLSIDCKEMPVGKVLDQLFAKIPVQYTLKENKVLIVKKPVPSPKIETPVRSKQVDSIRVKGTVIDIDGKPIAGATVLIEGSHEGTMTDVLGVFSLTASPGDVAMVSMVGMVDQRIEVPSRGSMKVTLMAKPTIQNDVVVVGYGKQSKLTVTGAVSTVNMDDVADRGRRRRPMA